MKAFFSFLIVFASALSAMAQVSNLIIFSDDGQPFTAYVNGEQVNASPQVNVKKTNIAADGVKVRVVFAKAIPELSKYIMLSPGEEITIGILKNKKGEYIFRPVSSAPIAGTSSTYTDASSYNANESYVDSDAGGNVNTTVTTQSTTINTQANTAAGINVSSNGGNVNVSINANIQDPAMSSSMTTTTTTSSTSSTSSDSNYEHVHHSNSHAYHNWDDCLLDNSGYESALNSIRSKSFSDSKMTLAKQVLKNNCVTTSQVKGFAQLFDYETDKLAFVKFAYDYTLDKKNFFKVNDIFTYESSIDELNKYLESKQ